MVEYNFTNGGNVITVITDGVDKTTENISIMQVKYNGSIGLSSAPTATQQAFGLKLNPLNTTKSILVALATALGWGLKQHNLGQVGTPDAITVLV
jgi:hypothetical protein